LAQVSSIVLLVTAGSLEARADEPAAKDPPAAQDPPTKDQCITANENGQTLRQGGKLREARAQLLVCVDPRCPDLVRDDCSERLNELDRSIPTIVFSAKGAADADLAAVKVTMDGAPFTERLDGSPIAVDPGEHTFEFTAEGFPPQKRVLVIGEGAKGRREEISLAPEAPVPVVPPVEPQPIAPPPLPPPNGDGQRLISYVLGGAGVVALGLGAYFGLSAQSKYDESSPHCPMASGSCDPEGVELGKDAHSLATASTIGFIAGGALLAGGVALFFTAPPSSAPSPSPSSARAWRSVNLRPTASASGAGLGIGGAW
jgi:hypothetical protein